VALELLEKETTVVLETETQTILKGVVVVVVELEPQEELDLVEMEELAVLEQLILEQLMLVEEVEVLMDRLEFLQEQEVQAEEVVADYMDQ
jgi:hypothetical protein